MDIAEGTGYSVSTLSNFLNGRAPGSEELIKSLAGFFKIKPDEIDGLQPPVDQTRELEMKDGAGVEAVELQEAFEFLVLALDEKEFKGILVKAADRGEMGVIQTLAAVRQKHAKKRTHYGKN